MISVVVGSSPVAVTGTFVMKPLPAQEDADPPEFLHTIPNLRFGIFEFPDNSLIFPQDLLELLLNHLKLSPDTTGKDVMLYAPHRLRTNVWRYLILIYVPPRHFSVGGGGGGGGGDYYYFFFFRLGQNS